MWAFGSHATESTEHFFEENSPGRSVLCDRGQERKNVFGISDSYEKRIGYRRDRKPYQAGRASGKTSL